METRRRRRLGLLLSSAWVLVLIVGTVRLMLLLLPDMSYLSSVGWATVSNRMCQLKPAVWKMLLLFIVSLVLVLLLGIAGTWIAAVRRLIKRDTAES